MRALALLVAAGCSTHAATPDAPASAAARCSALEGTTFASLAPGECGLGPSGPLSCTWHVTFSAATATTSSFDWQHSDYGESGSVSCAGADVTEIGGMNLHGTYNATTHHLIWDGVEYAP